ncbi:MAG: hypothetical protein U9Q03_03605 [Patescibacteria group bacterium]|nr:hypothetical protein [Patescibacteria group bacterium]
MNRREQIIITTLAAIAILLLPHGGNAQLPGARDVLVKASGPALYYYAEDGKRYVFPNERVYFSWFSDFSGIVEISGEELASIPIGGNVTYRPGIRLIKIQSDPKVYAIAPGGVLRWIENEQTAKDLYGVEWNKHVDDVGVAYFINYTMGESLDCACGYHPITVAAQANSINADKGIEVTHNTRLADTAVPNKKIDLNELTEQDQREYLVQFSLNHINSIRADHEKPPLILNDMLTEIALAHSMDMAFNIKEMSHEGSLGEQAHERIKEGKVPDSENPGEFKTLPYPDGIGWSGENVGRRYTGYFDGDVEAAIIDQHEWFMDEPDGEFNHRTTMLSSMAPFTEIGIGLYLHNDVVWITEDFISRSVSYAPPVEEPPAEEEESTEEESALAEGEEETCENETCPIET